MLMVNVAKKPQMNKTQSEMTESRNKIEKKK